MSSLVVLSKTAVRSTSRPDGVVQRLVMPQGTRTMTVLSKKSGEEYKKQNYYSRMKETGRPVSPHITMYKFPIVVFSSGINRATGCLMTLGAAGLGATELLGGSGASLHLMEYIGSQNFLIATTFKFGVSFNIIYHYGGGIRHLLWDEKPDLLTNEKSERSAYYLMGGATALSVATALM